MLGPEWYLELVEKLKDLDISILVNDVGMGTLGLAPKNVDVKLQDTLDITIVNCVPQVMFSGLFIPKFQKREKKSGIINLSSTSSLDNVHVDIYGATKAFNRKLSLDCGALYSNNQIDFFAIKPGWVCQALEG